MDKTKSNAKIWYHWLRRGLRWAIPIIVLYFVFQSIDFVKFKLSITQTNPWLVALGLAHAPLLILIATLRWRNLLMQYHRTSISFDFVLKHYWIGLALGFFSPASLGLDAYRVVVSGRHFGKYTLNTAIILVEKLIALLTCMSIIVVLYPLAPIAVTSEIKKVFYLAYILLFVSIFLITAIIIALRNRVLNLLLKRLELYFAGALERILGRLGLGNKAKTTKIPLREMMEPLANLKVIGIIALSFGIQFVSAVKSQIFFCALGYDLPFIVNLFAAPTLYFIFFLPISLGSIGIREGVYILLYGLFGVPVEIALLVSFFNLSGMILNSAIGGFIMLFSRSREDIRETAL